jgi:hypothetical protein
MDFNLFCVGLLPQDNDCKLCSSRMVLAAKKQTRQGITFTRDLSTLVTISSGPQATPRLKKYYAVVDPQAATMDDKYFGYGFQAVGFWLILSCCLFTFVSSYSAR